MTKEKYNFCEDDLFVMCSMPGSRSVDLYIHDDSASQHHFVIHPFIRHQIPTTILKTDQIIADPIVEFSTSTECSAAETSKRAYMDQAGILQRLLQNGKLRKAILSRIKLAVVDRPNYVSIFQQLVETYPKAFCYFYNIPGEGSWMGASPEVLLESHQAGFSTVALAGTQAVPDIPHDVIEWGEKEIEEQAIIVDYVAARLKEKQIDFTLSGPKTSKAGNVYHLKSVFNSNDNIDPVELALSLHPGPAISGYPVGDAIKTIRSLETHDRAYYCGFLGPQDFEKTSLFINLRCMQLFSNAAALYVGGGYTAASVPEDEWKETELKSKTLLQVIEDAHIEADGI